MTAASAKTVLEKCTNGHFLCRNNFENFKQFKEMLKEKFKGIEAPTIKLTVEVQAERIAAKTEATKTGDTITTNEADPY